MGGFNLNQATKAIKHVAHTTVDLANPLSDVYQPAPGRSRADQLRTIGRKDAHQQPLGSISATPISTEIPSALRRCAHNLLHVSG